MKRKRRASRRRKAKREEKRKILFPKTGGEIHIGGSLDGLRGGPNLFAPIYLPDEETSGV